MNFTETFNEFSSRLGPTDLALYAGVGVVLWVLFKDQLSPIQKLILDFVNKLKNKHSNNTDSNFADKIKEIVDSSKEQVEDTNLFFDLVVSWKQTRDLAEKSGCKKAVEVADQMFPYLSPMVCDDITAKKEENNEE
jgi:hypothetical protein